jgi:hypothetical protein
MTRQDVSFGSISSESSKDPRVPLRPLSHSKLNLLPGDTLVTPAPDGASSLNWVSQTMFRLGLRGFLPTDSLRALARRVR